MNILEPYKPSDIQQTISQPTQPTEPINNNVMKPYIPEAQTTGAVPVQQPVQSAPQPLVTKSPDTNNLVLSPKVLDYKSQGIQPFTQQPSVTPTALVDSIYGVGSEYIKGLKTQKSAIDQIVESRYSDSIKRGVQQSQTIQNMGNVTELNKMNEQYAQAKKVWDGIIDNYNSDGRLTADTHAGRVNNLKSQMASELGSLAALIQAKQGNMNLALQTYKTAIDVENEPKKQELEYRIKQLENVDSEILGVTKEKRQMAIDEYKSKLNQIETETEYKLKAFYDQTSDSKPASVKEYEYLKTLTPEQQQEYLTMNKQSLGGGATGSTDSLSPLAQSILQEPALLKNLTSTMKQEIMGELANNGYDITQLAVGDMSGAEQTKLSMLDNLLSNAQSALDLIDSKKVITGPVRSRFKNLQSDYIGGVSSEYTSYRSLVSNFTTELLNAKSGAAVTEAEYAKLAPLLQIDGLPTETAQQKLDLFVKEFTKIRNNFIERSTQTPTQAKRSITSSNTSKKVPSSDYIKTNFGSWEQI
jgi:hypothetical protein